MPPLQLTAAQAKVMEALQKGRDPLYFFTEILGIDVNPAQRRWIEFIRPEENGWAWRYKLVAHVAANQIGKTLGLGGLILWACWYKMGIPLTDMDRWQNAPYVWFHLAPSQQQAYLTYKDMVALAKGDHPAQKRPCLIPQGWVQQIKVEQYYDGLSLWNGAIIQFRTTDDKAKALQGRRANGISYDECAFEDHLLSVINETLMMRLISTGGPLWLVSTPNGINDWFEVVSAIRESSATPPMVEADSPLAGGSAPVGSLLPMWTNSDGHALLWSTVQDNVGFGLPAEEVERMERNLQASTKEQQLRGAFLEPAEAYFVPAEVTDKAFRANLPMSELPKPDHRYVAAWDLASASAGDPCVCIVIDVTTTPWRGVYFRYYDRPPGEVKLLEDMYAIHALYSGSATQRLRHQAAPKCTTAFDATSMGGSMMTHALAGLFPKKPLNMAGPQTKQTALSNLRAALNLKQLILPRWPRVRREVLTYKLPDDKIMTDCVMALMMGVAAARGAGGETKPVKFDVSGRVSKQRYYPIG